LSIKRNILASYVGQIYVTVIGIAMVPFYLRYMGAEAYGLVGFFAMLQAWFQLLDMGLTPTMARETARYNGGAIDELGLRRLLRALEGVFVGIACVGATVILACSELIARNWLKVQHLPTTEVRHAIMLMGVIVAFRWVSGLYRGAINGFERQIWLSGFNIIFVTARFVLVIPVFFYIGASPTSFFGYQLIVAAFELLLLVVYTYNLLPKVKAGMNAPWEWEPLRKVLKFSLGIAFTSSVWVLVTQTDKLVLSKLLPLADYAFFTLAVLVASGVMVISGPISGALLPRMTRLAAEGKDPGLIKLYRNATQLVSIIAVPTALMLAFFSYEVLWAWTGDAEIAAKAAKVLTLYALGNGILALAAFPYYLQFAKGDLKLHLIGNALFVTILIPALIWATIQYGVVGAGYAWLGSNALYFLTWIPLVHARFVIGLHMRWLMKDIGAPVIVTFVGASLAHLLVKWPHDRAGIFVILMVLGTALIGCAALTSSYVRRAIGEKLNRR
jgi:O-antigen/teichoic acid export membrane protein